MYHKITAGQVWIGLPAPLPWALFQQSLANVKFRQANKQIRTIT